MKPCVKAALIVLACIVVNIAFLSLLYILFNKSHVKESTGNTENATSNAGVANNQKDIEYVQYPSTDYPDLGYTFSYPKDWIVEPTVDIGIKRISIISPDNNYEIGFDSSFETNSNNTVDYCEILQDCGGSDTREGSNYNPGDFEAITNLDSTELYLPTLGVCSDVYIQDEYTTQCAIPKRYNSGVLYQEYENGITADLTIFGHEKDGERFLIYYVFNTDEAISNWAEYKEIIRTFAGSIQPIE
jgi:hypothetical protein